MKKIQSNEFGKTAYVVESSGGMVSVHHNDYDVSCNDVFIRIGKGRVIEQGEYTAVTGKKNIEDLILAIAVSGGLIEEGDKLVLQSEVPIPTKNGMYLLTGEDFEDRIVAVIDGKYFSPNVFYPTQLTDITSDIAAMVEVRGTKLVPMKVRC